MSAADKIGLGPTRVIKVHDGGVTIEVTPPPMFGLPMRKVSLDPDQYERYKLWSEGNMLIQQALPDLSANQREILMTGTCQEDFYNKE